MIEITPPPPPSLSHSFLEKDMLLSFEGVFSIISNDLHISSLR